MSLASSIGQILKSSNMTKSGKCEQTQIDLVSGKDCLVKKTHTNTIICDGWFPKNNKATDSIAEAFATQRPELLQVVFSNSSMTNDKSAIKQGIMNMCFSTSSAKNTVSSFKDNSLKKIACTNMTDLQKHSYQMTHDGILDSKFHQEQCIWSLVGKAMTAQGGTYSPSVANSPPASSGLCGKGTMLIKGVCEVDKKRCKFY